ncbi:hypothetical protein E4T56_gene6906, partial [Termitomyces sp. T112]
MHNLFIEINLGVYATGDARTRIDITQTARTILRQLNLRTNTSRKLSMSQELDEQISQLKKYKWVDLHGLVTCATLHLSTPESDGPRCVSISLLAASISCYDKDNFNPEAKRSEISTMSFVRESGLYPDVPVPKVLAFDLTFTNPACAPYVLMEVVPGVTVELEDNKPNDADATS